MVNATFTPGPNGILTSMVSRLAATGLPVRRLTLLPFRENLSRRR